MADVMADPRNTKLKPQTNNNFGLINRARVGLGEAVKAAPQVASRTKEELFSARKGEGKGAVKAFSGLLSPAKKKAKVPAGYKGTGGLNAYEILGYKW